MNLQVEGWPRLDRVVRKGLSEMTFALDLSDNQSPTDLTSIINHVFLFFIFYASSLVQAEFSLV